MTEVMSRHLLFSLPNVLLSQVYEFDDTYRIFGSDKFKKDLQYGWLKMQSSYTKEKVTELIIDYIENNAYENEYCYISGPQTEFEVEEVQLYGRQCFMSYDQFMVYVAPPMNDNLYYKILPKSFINKEKEFFENLKFDGFLCHINSELNHSQRLNVRDDKLLYRKYWNLYWSYVQLVYQDRWYTTSEGQKIYPFMYKNCGLWF